MVNGQNHLGKIYAVKNNGNNPVLSHFSETMGALSDRELRTMKDIQKHKNILNRVSNKTKYTNMQIQNIIKTFLNSKK